MTDYSFYGFLKFEIIVFRMEIWALRKLGWEETEGWKFELFLTRTSFVGTSNRHGLLAVATLNLMTVIWLETRLHRIIWIFVARGVTIMNGLIVGWSYRWIKRSGHWTNVVETRTKFVARYHHSIGYANCSDARSLSLKIQIAHLNSTTEYFIYFTISRLGNWLFAIKKLSHSEFCLLWLQLVKVLTRKNNDIFYQVNWIQIQ